MQPFFKDHPLGVLLYIQLTTSFLIGRKSTVNFGISAQATTFKVKKIQGLFKDLHRILRTFQDCVNPVYILRVIN